VHIDGKASRSCSLPIRLLENSEITTIEGLTGPISASVQDAWRQIDVPQCGYCQSGQIMSGVALLTENGSPSDADIDGAMRGNVCRCATYHRIRAAIHIASGHDVNLGHDANLGHDVASGYDVTSGHDANSGHDATSDRSAVSIADTTRSAEPATITNDADEAEEQA
jgi:xanthine dehydrogenase iron-sulfur cluster and FAD-binding subunit A